MFHFRTDSSHQPPSSPSSSSNTPRSGEDRGLEGIATNVKLLLKLIEDHNGSSTRDNELRKCHRVNGMISILDEVKSRIQRSQSDTNRRAEFRRSNSDIKSSSIVSQSKENNKSRFPELITDDKDRLRRELQSSLVARHSLQVMCSSLGKEKQIMAAELARKAQELTEMEEFVNDLKEQNEMLVNKLQQSCNVVECEEEKSEIEGVMAVQERNKVLMEQLQRSLDAYKTLKRKFREAREQNREFHSAMDAVEVDVQQGIDKVRGFMTNAEKLTTDDEEQINNIKHQILGLEQMLLSLQVKISKSKRAHKKN